MLLFFAYIRPVVAIIANKMVILLFHRTVCV